MEPYIKPKELLIIKEAENYNINDVITYRESFGKLITHRIIGIDGNYYITKGDSNKKEDDKIKKEKIEGKVIFHSSFLGTVFLYWLKPIIICIILLYLFDFLKYILLIKMLLK